MRVVDVEPGPVGEDDVGQPEVFVGELAGVGSLPGEVEAARVAERVLLLEVPPGPARPCRGRRLVGVHDLGGGDHGIGTRLAGHRDAVLGLGPHHAPHAHGESLAGRGSAPAPTAPRASTPGGSRGPPPRAGTVLTYRYWPVLATVSIERPASVPCLPDTRVLM